MLKTQVTPNKSLVISTLGSSVTSGSGSTGVNKTWVNKLYERLKKERGLEKLRYHNSGWGGYTTSRIVKEKKADVLIQQKPNVILFETCLLNDYGQNVPVETTKKNIELIIMHLHTELPDSRIILQSPNPRLHGEAKNKEGLSYEDYIRQTEEFIKSKGWEYINIYDAMNKELANLQTPLKDIMYDDAHPNDKGYDLWAKILETYFLTGKQQWQ
ncbi:SGNH/GDSL hydrolase family protein [Paenibacillus elgii]